MKIFFCRCRSTSVRQISIASEPDRTFFLKLDWAGDLGSGFVILLSDGISAWSGEVSEEDVSREAQEIEMERERYVGDLHLALTGEGPAAEGQYSFHLTPERPGRPLLQLSYEKVQNDISSGYKINTHRVPDAKVGQSYVVEVKFQTLKKSSETLGGPALCVWFSAFVAPRKRPFPQGQTEIGSQRPHGDMMASALGSAGHLTDCRDETV
ncbi:DNA repair protein XRCC4 [Labeo rohita]|uniref:DNA repair protein XRCC4 n=1 Tax=Labeo rohita TaxID=84645 RepID=A0ABQ8MEL8_LABRO|nr:DNA repair protein XRCC4 [Labeo rohita]